MADYTLFDRFLTELADGNEIDMGLWTIKIPVGYTVSTDKNITGGFCLVAISNDGSTNISAPSEATIGLNVQVGRCPLNGTSINLMEERYRKVAQKIVFDQVRGWWEENVAVNDVMFSVYKYVCYQILEIENCWKFKCCIFDGDDLYLMSIFFNTNATIVPGKGYEHYERMCRRWLGTIKFKGNATYTDNSTTAGDLAQCENISSPEQILPPWAEKCQNLTDEMDYQMGDDDSFKLYLGIQTRIFLPDGIKAISNMAFWSEKIEAVVIPEGVITIGNSAFENCSALEQIHLPSSLKSIGSNAFKHCSALTNIHLPVGMETISMSTFSQCENIESVVIPEGVKVICLGAFSECKNLSSVTLPSTLKKIEFSAFYGCKRLTSVTIPDGVEEIEANAFRDCSKLADVYLPASVINIGKDAFKKVKKDQKVMITIHAPADSFAAKYAEQEGLSLNIT